MFVDTFKDIPLQKKGLKRTSFRDFIMTTVFDVNANDFIAKTKEELKKVEQIKMPDWAKFVKTSSARTKPPEQDDFWHVRAAAVLRQIYIRGTPVGVQRLRVKYGGKTMNNSKKKRERRGSGKMLRVILQQLESAGFLQKETVKNQKGRVITSKGKSFLDKIAAQSKRG